jgi:NADPH-dependent 2,4-dienoyl-CoA reductase/sulfur reductase-like enzyme
MAAQTLREAGYGGQLMMISRDNELPYDRPNLSKEYMAGEAKPEWMPLRPREFYRDHDIELTLGKEVTGIDVDNQDIEFSTGGLMRYDALLLTTGGRPRKLELPGSELENVMVLRSYSSADEILARAENAKQVAIVGANFIGMETAASLRERDLQVTVIAPDAVPFEKVFGTAVGSLFRRTHEEEGVRFELENEPAQVEGNAKVESVLLKNGQRVTADLVLFGVGVDPATDFIRSLDLAEDGSVPVNEYLEAAKNLWAAGDIARFNDWRTGESTRIEHWRTAQQQGRVAAFNMLGKQVRYRSVPFFWTKQAGLNFKYVGHVKNWDDTIIDGDVDSGDFIIYYAKNGKVLAVAGNNRGQELAAAEELMRRDQLPSPDELTGGRVDLVARLREAVEA